MSKRRSRGDGGLHWDSTRERWIASVTIGYTPAGKRIVRRGSGKTKTEAKTKLRDVLRDHQDGLAIAPHGYTVADAVIDWLTYGLSGRSANTITKNRHLCQGHILPDLGARKLRELTAEDVDQWLAAKARTLSSATVQNLYSCLNRAVTRAMARDKVKRNVVALCGTRRGRKGVRLSHSPSTRPGRCWTRPRTAGSMPTLSYRCSPAPGPRSCASWPGAMST
jgi:hypothetical protein